MKLTNFVCFHLFGLIHSFGFSLLEKEKENVNYVLKSKTEKTK
jgi:hypothetical protein